MSGIDNTQATMRKFDPVIKDLSMHELIVLKKMVVERIRIMQKAGTLMSMSQFHVGDRVLWNASDGIVRTGIILRINHKTVSVDIGNKSYWNVSPQLLRKES
jgi:hypothetical protein